MVDANLHLSALARRQRVRNSGLKKRHSETTCSDKLATIRRLRGLEAFSRAIKVPSGQTVRVLLGATNPHRNASAHELET